MGGSGLQTDSSTLWTGSVSFDGQMERTADAGTGALFLFMSPVDCNEVTTSMSRIVLAAPVSY